MRTADVHWANRHTDSTFDDFDSLKATLDARKESSIERVVPLADLHVAALEDGNMALAGADGGAMLNHWSFAQLCARVGANAAFLRKLPANLAAAPLNYCIKHADAEKIKVMLRKNGIWTAAAVTSESYGRVYDADLLTGVLENFDPKEWRPPVGSKASADKGRASRLYASDRAMHLTLVNENNPIEIPGPTGTPTALFRGVIIGHSDVGYKPIWVRQFLYKYDCDNREIWSTQFLQEIRIRHTSGAPARWFNEAMPELHKFINSPTQPIVDLVKKARDAEVAEDRDGVIKFLRGRSFTRSQAVAAADAAEQNEDEASPRSVWGLMQAITNIAHDTKFQDNRVDLEVAAGRLIQQAA